MEDAAQAPGAVPGDAFSRFRRWVAIALAIAVLGYLGYAVWRGFGETWTELSAFRWSLYVPVLGLTLVNYGLRYWKWAWLLQRLDVRVPTAANLWIFVAGLAMVISPGKAGELVKPYLVREITGAPMSKTIPVLVAERGTDGIAVVALAAVGVSTYYSDGTRLIFITLGSIVAGLIVIAIKPLSLAIIELIGKLPVVGGIAPRLAAFYLALRSCLSPWSLFVTTVVSIVAWFAECIGYWLIFRGLHVEATLDAATFLYAFATVFGAPSPGGMGMADAALAEGSLAVVPGLTGGGAVAAALLVRVATLWFGVLLGAFSLLRIEDVIRTYRTVPR
jgi:uncharacterized protein (TIRG00374 family)